MSDNKKESDVVKGNLLKIFGKTSGVIIEDVDDIVYERFPSGSLILDRNLKGGYVKGSCIELFGESQSGKTTKAIHAVAEHQKKYPDELVLWLDLEKTFDPVYFRTIGIDLSSDKFILARPSKGEDVWEAIIDFHKNYGKGIVVLDSVALLLNEKELEGDVGDAHMAGAARMNSQGFRKLFPYTKFGGTTFFAINQVRSNIGGYGSPTTTTGGKAWDFLTRTRVQCSASKGVEGEFAKHKYKLIKATYGKKDTVSEVNLYYGKGYDKYREVVDLCELYGIIQRGGSWYSYQDTKLGQGGDNVALMLQDNIELYEELEGKLLEIFKKEEEEYNAK